LKSKKNVINWGLALLIYIVVFYGVRFVIDQTDVEGIYRNIHSKITVAKQKARASQIKQITIPRDAIIIRSESNLNNQGVALETQDAYYLVNDMLLLEKMDKSFKKDLSFQVTSERWSIGGLQIVGDWLFYTSDGIHRINLDGTRGDKLYDGGVMDMYVTPEWIYFVDYKHHNYLYRMTINGDDLRCIRDSCFRDLLFDGNKFYATMSKKSNDDDEKIVSFAIEENEIRILDDAYGHNLIKEDNYLYYRKSKDWYLWRTNLETLESEVVIPNRMTYFALDKDYIFYSVRDEDGAYHDDSALFRLDRETNDIIVIDDKTRRSTGVISLLGDQVLIESDYKEHPFAWIRMSKEGDVRIFMEARDD